METKLVKIEEAFQGVDKVFLDTAPVVYYVEARTEFVTIVRPIFHLLNAAQFEGVASPVTLAAEMRSRYNLKLPDALQIATAIASNCQAFLTNDAQLKRIPDLRVLVISELEA